MTTEDFKHKLTAILSADVQGYSRLMEEDQESTVRTLTAYRDLMAVLIQKHRGRIVDTPGDNLLAEFDSLTDAVHCAVEIQEELRIRNAELSEDRKMRFRIGINLGEIIEDRDHIYGDGINVAARVEGLADGGGICISGAVYDAIKNKLSMSYEFMGEHNVKNIKEPVRVYRIRVEPEAETAKVKEKKAGSRRWQWAALSVAAIIILGVVAYALFNKFYLVASDVQKAKKTIAVLPFVNLSPDPDQEYFVDGLSEELLNSLTNIPDLRVTARTSSFLFKDSDKSVQEIAIALGVENILEGSVRKADSMLRVTAQLVRASDGFHLWSKTYDRELKDIFAVQEDIATAVADELKASLGIGKSIKKLGGTDNMEAYELFLIAQGQSFRGEYSLALKSIDAAIALDPEFSLALAMKALTHENLSMFGPTNRITVELDAGLSAAQRAIEIEPNLAEAYAVLGSIRSAAGDWIEAELAFRKALELATESSFLEAQSYSTHLFAVGYFDKVHEFLKENRIRDPLNRGYRFLYITSFGFLGDRQQSEKEYESCRDLFGDNWVGFVYMVQVRLGLGDFVSKDDIQEVFELSPYRIEIDMQSPEKGIAELRRFYADNNDLPAAVLCFVTLIAANLGDNELSMDIMEKMTSSNPKSVFWIWLPVMQEVRQTTRFKTLIREIGLVDYWNEFGWPDICRQLENGDFECD